MAGNKGQKKRFWSNEEKVSICAQTCAPGVSVAQVARRYAKNTNLIHKWLRDPEFAPDRTDYLTPSIRTVSSGGLSQKAGRMA